MKVKKWLASLLAGTLMVGMLAVNTNAAITNPNDVEVSGDWYCVNVLELFGPEQALQVHGIKFYFSGITEPDTYNGAIALNSTGGWNQVDFDIDRVDVPTKTTADTTQFTQRSPFFKENDVAGDESWAKIMLNVWTGDAAVDKYEVLDADGNVMTPGAAPPATPEPPAATPEPPAATPEPPVATADPDVTNNTQENIQETTQRQAPPTGDNSLIALFSALFAAAAAGLVALRVSRKQKSY